MKKRVNLQESYWTKGHSKLHFQSHQKGPCMYIFILNRSSCGVRPNLHNSMLVCRRQGKLMCNGSFVLPRASIGIPQIPPIKNLLLTQSPPLKMGMYITHVPYTFQLQIGLITKSHLLLNYPTSTTAPSYLSSSMLPRNFDNKGY
jgi:hypothetical protein